MRRQRARQSENGGSRHSIAWRFVHPYSKLASRAHGRSPRGEKQSRPTQARRRKCPASRRQSLPKSNAKSNLTQAPSTGREIGQDLAATPLSGRVNVETVNILGFTRRRVKFGKSRSAVLMRRQPCCLVQRLISVCPGSAVRPPPAPMRRRSRRSRAPTPRSRSSSPCAHPPSRARRIRSPQPPARSGTQTRRS